jgi:hypothetical protein
MERVYIEWSIVNWITVMLMAVFGFMLVNFVMGQLPIGNE